MALFVILLGTLGIASSAPYFGKYGTVREIQSPDIMGDVLPKAFEACMYSKTGCCSDGKTIAPGPGRGEGCDVALCTDSNVGYCYDKKLDKTLDCDDEADGKTCKFSCRKCHSAATPLSRCEKLQPKYGCCWDGRPALKADKSDCPVCRDSFSNSCSLFKGLSGGCQSGSYGIRFFMTNNCPKSCGFCTA
ncbi:papilin [Nematostella vectensis]|uniref:papilin n=1 Tax=Nematostella vectensis TaxID=45351 RepID=UPI00207737D5|nr:papilin [Nematostella vectensis]